MSDENEIDDNENEIDDEENEQEPKMIFLPLEQTYLTSIKLINTCNYLKEITLNEKMEYCIELIQQRSEIEGILNLTKKTIPQTIMLLDDNLNGNLSKIKKELEQGINTLITHYEKASEHCATRNCTNCINEITQAKKELSELIQNYETLKIKQPREEHNNYV